MQRLHLHAQGLAQKARGQLFDVFGVGGGEQQRLPALGSLRDDLGDGVVKAHVEHAVGLVEDQRIEPVEPQRGLAQMFLDATGRTDDDMGAVLERTDLRADRHPAAEGQDLDVARSARESAQLLGDLVGEFARRAQHQRLAAEVARVQGLEQGDAEGRRLAAAGLGLGDHILALEHRRQALGLDRRHLAIAEGVEVGLGGGAQRQAGEGRTGHGRDSGRRAQFNRSVGMACGKHSVKRLAEPCAATRIRKASLAFTGDPFCFAYCLSLPSCLSPRSWPKSRVSTAATKTSVSNR